MRWTPLRRLEQELAGYVYAPDAELDSTEIEAIEGVAREYWDANYRADAGAFEAVVHPDFELRGLTRRLLDTRAKYVAVDAIPRAEMAYICALGLGVSDEEPVNEVTVLAATHYVASVKAVGRGQTHILHLMRLPEGWSIVGAVFAFDGGVIPNQTFDI